MIASDWDKCTDEDKLEFRKVALRGANTLTKLGCTCERLNIEVHNLNHITYEHEDGCIFAGDSSIKVLRIDYKDEQS